MLILLPAVAQAESAFERKVIPREITATSHLKNGWNPHDENYHPMYAFDGDGSTAWVPGPYSDYEDPTLRASFSLKKVSSVRVRVRCADETLPAFSAARTSASHIDVMLVPSGETLSLEPDGSGWVEASVSLPTREVNALVFTSWGNIADVEIFATSTESQNPDLERKAQTTISEWIATRRKNSQIFQKPLPLANDYQKVEEAELGTSPTNCWENPTQKQQLTCAFQASLNRAKLQPTLAAMISQELGTSIEELFGKRFKKKFTPAKLNVTDRRELPGFEGVPSFVLIENYVGLLQTSSFTASAGSGPSLDQILSGKHKACKKKISWEQDVPAFAWTAESPNGAGLTVVLAECGMRAQRTGYEPVANLQVLHYDRQGHLTLAISDETAVALSWSKNGNSEMVSTIRYIQDDMHVSLKAIVDSHVAHHAKN